MPDPSVRTSFTLAVLLLTTAIVPVSVVTNGQAAEFEIRRITESVQKKTRFLNSEFVVAGSPRIQSSRKVPLLIFLHGAGGRGQEIGRIRRMIQPIHGKAQRMVSEPFLMVAPQSLMGTREIAATWLPSDLDELLEHLKKTLPVDETRIYLTGTSMGGYGTWVWAAHSPQHFAAVAPVVGGLGKGGPKDVSPELEAWAKQLTRVPVWAFAGANDRVVPAERSERMIRMIRQQGGKQARLTVYPDEGHGAGRRVYESKEFYSWMFSLRKSPEQKLDGKNP